MLPILYSFRRCPYAIRARYVIAYLDIQVHLREVLLKSKPPELLALGGRSTVPQLIDSHGERYPESLDIIFWALSFSKNHERASQLWPETSKEQNKIRSWIVYNDHFFKYWLDRYKYADRYPESSQSFYRYKGEVFLHRLDKRLKVHSFLFGECLSVADIAIFPFVRQFSLVDWDWFEQSPYHNVKAWLAGFLNSDIFKSVVMVKHDVWKAGQEDILYPA